MKKTTGRGYVRVKRRLIVAEEEAAGFTWTLAADANVLEEGLAVHFQEWHMHHVLGDRWWSGRITFPAYAEALAQTRRLLALDPEIIRKIRRQQPVIARITAEQISEHCPAASQELCQALATKFVRVETPT